jgi:predicted component of type VI protein secretion system
MVAHLIITNGKHAGRDIAIRRPSFVIGSAEDCNLRIRGGRIGRHHCAISVQNGIVAISGLDRQNQTFVNGGILEKHTKLKAGDRIGVGSFEFELRVVSDRPEKGPAEVTSNRKTAPPFSGSNGAGPAEAAEQEEPIEIVGVWKGGHRKVTAAKPSDAAAAAIRELLKRI